MKRRHPRAWAGCILTAAAVLPPPLWPFPYNTGGSPAQFLEIGAGARALGMGDAYAAVAEGPEAVYWNPAGLASISRPEFAYSRSEHMRGFHHDWGAYAHPVKAIRGTLAVSLTHFSQDTLPVLTNAGAPAGNFNPHSEVIAVAYASQFKSGERRHEKEREYFADTWNVPGAHRPLDEAYEPWTGTVLAGVSVKAVRETYYLRNATAFAIDGGALFRPLVLKDLSLAFAFRNIGEGMRFIKEDHRLPVELEFGAAYQWRWRGSKLLAATAVTLPYYGLAHAQFGAEFSRTIAKKSWGALRVGLKTRTLDDLEPLSGLTAGAGLRAGAVALDFAAQPAAGLGETYRMSLSYRF